MNRSQKYLWFFIAVMLILGAGCQQKPAILTDAEKAEIEKQILGQWNQAIASVGKLDADAWLANFSTTHFLAHLFSGQIILSRQEYLETVKGWWSGLSKFEVTPTKVKVTILSPTLALLDATSDAARTTRDNAVSQAKHAVSVVYQKEANAWKIIHIHESISEMKG